MSGHNQTPQIKDTRPFLWDERLDDSDKDDIAELNTSIGKLSALRAVQINKAGHFAQSKLAWKLASHQHALLHRIVDLFDGAAVAWNNDCPLTAILAARAFMETFALMVDFKRAVTRHLKAQDFAALDALAQHGMFATRDLELLKTLPDIKATNAVTYVDKYSKLSPDFGQHYAMLSERCHPNAQGHSFMFTTLDRTNGTVDFTTAKDIKQTAALILAALGTAPMVEGIMAELDREIGEIAELHHRIKPVGGP